MAVKLSEMVAAVAWMYGGIYVSSTATGTGTTTTLVCSDLIGSDLANGHWLDVGGEVRMVSGFDKVNGVVTVGVPFSSATTGKAFVASARKRADIKIAIGEAQMAMGLAWLVPMIDETITLIPNVQTYDLPEGCVEVQSLYVAKAPVAGQAIVYVPFDYFETVGNADGRRKLVLKDGVGTWASTKTRLHYSKKPTTLVNDNDTLGLPPEDEASALEFIKNWSVALLLRREATRNATGENARSWIEMAKVLERSAQDARSKQAAGRTQVRLRVMPRSGQI